MKIILSRLQFFIFLGMIVFSYDSYCSNRDEWQKPNHIIKSLKLDKNKDVICEIGAGNGYFSKKFSPHVKHIFAVEVEVEKVQELKENLIKNEISNVTPILGAYTSPLLQNKSCDIIFFAMTYHHIDNRVAYLEKIKPFLKKGGRLVNIDNVIDVEKYKYSTKRTSAKACRFSREKFLSEAKLAGFKQSKSHKLSVVQYFEELVLKNSE